MEPEWLPRLLNKENRYEIQIFYEYTKASVRLIRIFVPNSYFVAKVSASKKSSS